MIVVFFAETEVSFQRRIVKEFLDTLCWLPGLFYRMYPLTTPPTLIINHSELSNALLHVFRGNLKNFLT